MSQTAPWLNYNHLYYFYVVVTEGGIAQAARKLRLSRPTVSEQIRSLELVVGEPLFAREGRSLSLTYMGRHVYQYAKDMFALGQELSESIRAPAGAPRMASRAIRLAVGVSDVVPKVIARRVLASLEGPEDNALRLLVRQGSIPRLLEDLAQHTLDVLITESSTPPGTSPQVFSHVLGECGTAFFAAESLARKLVGPFPQCLDGQPFLLPGPTNFHHHTLISYFGKHRIAPRVVAEIDDSALLKAYGEDGRGVFAGPVTLATEIESHYKVTTVGVERALRERFYLLTAQRRVVHPMVSKLLSLRHDMFSEVSDSSPPPRK